MLTPDRIDAIGWEVARACMPPGAVLSLSSEPAEDWDGEPLLRFLFVLADAQADSAIHEGATRSLLALQDRLREAGETRRGTIGYATDTDLAREQAELDAEEHAAHGRP